MKRIEIVDCSLEFASELETRDETNFIVIHHTGSGADQNYDWSAEEIHSWHIQKWAGIGYHYVVRKNGTVEQGRPHWTIGAHAYGRNYESIGIHLSGDFSVEAPTTEQVEAAALLIANVCTDYGLPIDRQHVLGHREVGDSDCPGDVLFEMLDEIVGKAIWYSQQNDDAEDGQPEEVTVEHDGNSEDIDTIAILARKYESNGDPACISSGIGDLGGKSYGLYQMASRVGVVDEFVRWLCNYPDDALANYGRELDKWSVNSQGFMQTWKELGTIDPGGFGRLQDEYIKEQYYDKAAEMLIAKHYDIEKHSVAMKAVLMSRAVQNGTTGAAVLFVEAQKIIIGYPNLSYVDDSHFDDRMISAVYNYLIRECELATWKGTCYRSPNDFCCGSGEIIAGLKSRFVREMADALAML